MNFCTDRLIFNVVARLVGLSQPWGWGLTTECLSNFCALKIKSKHDLKYELNSGTNDYLNLEMISQVEGYKMSTCFLCDAPCENKCPVEGCETYYCSLEHLRHHQILLEDGRTLCMPFKIDHSPTKGRHFVATRFDQPFEMLKGPLI